MGDVIHIYSQASDPGSDHAPDDDDMEKIHNMDKLCAPAIINMSGYYCHYWTVI